MDYGKAKKFGDTVLNRGRVSDQIKEAIKQSILSGEFKAGDKLPREDQIATLLKVSKVTVREALRDLEVDGMIEKRRGSAGGNFVAQPNINKMNDLIMNCFQFGTVTPIELLEAGQMLEQWLLSLAAKRRTEDDLTKMTTNIREREESLASRVIDLRKMIAFHHIVVDSCHDRILSALLHALITVSVRNLSAGAFTLDDYQAHLKYSKQLFKSMLRQDGEAGRNSMVSIFKRYLDVLQGYQGKDLASVVREEKVKFGETKPPASNRRPLLKGS